MNRTFLLAARDIFTEGSMLIVIESLAEFQRLFKEYHAKKLELLQRECPEFFMEHRRETLSQLRGALDHYYSRRYEFIAANNKKPFDFEFYTGCHYIKDGPGAGSFYDDIKIVEDPGVLCQECWQVVREFMSDLPTGTHYCGDMRA